MCVCVSVDLGLCGCVCVCVFRGNIHQVRRDEPLINTTVSSQCLNIIVFTQLIGGWCGELAIRLLLSWIFGTGKD